MASEELPKEAGVGVLFTPPKLDATVEVGVVLVAPKFGAVVLLGTLEKEEAAVVLGNEPALPALMAGGFPPETEELMSEGIPDEPTVFGGIEEAAESPVLAVESNADPCCPPRPASVPPLPLPLS